MKITNIIQASTKKASKDVQNECLGLCEQLKDYINKYLEQFDIGTNLVPASSPSRYSITYKYNVIFNGVRWKIKHPYVLTVPFGEVVKDNADEETLYISFVVMDYEGIFIDDAPTLFKSLYILYTYLIQMPFKYKMVTSNAVVSTNTITLQYANKDYLEHYAPVDIDHYGFIIRNDIHL